MTVPLDIYSKLYLKPNNNKNIINEYTGSYRYVGVN